jgi:hypothetical protein
MLSVKANEEPYDARVPDAIDAHYVTVVRIHTGALIQNEKMIIVNEMPYSNWTSHEWFG